MITCSVLRKNINLNVWLGTTKTNYLMASKGEVWERPFIKLLHSSKVYTLPYSALELKDRETLRTMWCHWFLRPPLANSPQRFSNKVDPVFFQKSVKWKYSLHLQKDPILPNSQEKCKRPPQSSNSGFLYLSYLEVKMQICRKKQKQNAQPGFTKTSLLHQKLQLHLTQISSLTLEIQIVLLWNFI